MSYLSSFLIKTKISSEELSKPLKLSKPSLDSDEEDYDDKDCFRLHETDIDGQEATTLEYDDEVKITPFNMKEELEEDGHFDSAGTFIFKKQIDARDNWLEDINWLEVKKNQEKNALKDTSISDELGGKVLGKEEKLTLYQELLSYLQPSETVLRSIKRMGACSDAKKSASASQRWLLKKKTKTEAHTGDPEGLIRVTELADQLVQGGDFDVYQKTYDDIKKLIERTKQSSVDDELDVLGQAFDEKQTNDADGAKSTEEHNDDNHNDNSNGSTSIMWHLKRSNKPNTEIEGPYTSEQLKIWLQDGTFNHDDSHNILIRESTKSDGQFYNITRIDFDLYE
ncbi:CD2 antigen cytoplasmic tail-binding protein 2 [Schistosoma japonicum]|uniref:CD2 antigen cytoplasmic tail-binding protein 2 n=1 Tax=Schistosoma japonicum TaxID=6182 RepID=A0A4Z2DQU3_SCHJA|nr:CD2 antigen cytoplasmic tail-binding protein 2 like [Schistosoma japonicum]TNN18876.1 CD2 antigen cytoplasmic tail-binding protein 2 [Schistosoma japonicum]